MVSAGGIIGAAIGLGIAAIVLGAFVGPQIANIFTVNQSTWDASTIAIWGVIGVFIGLAALLIILRVAGVNIGGM